MYDDPSLWSLIWHGMVFAMMAIPLWYFLSMVQMNAWINTLEKRIERNARKYKSKIKNDEQKTK